jgi:hypothetical protein
MQGAHQSDPEKTKKCFVSAAADFASVKDVSNL